MKRLIQDIEENGGRGTEPLPARSTEITEEMRREIERMVEPDE
jgi:hypothetical protein